MTDFVSLQCSENEADILCFSSIAGEYLTVLNVSHSCQESSGDFQTTVKLNGSDYSIADAFSPAFNHKLNSVLKSWQNRNETANAGSMRVLSEEIEFLLQDKMSKINLQSKSSTSSIDFSNTLSILDGNAFEDLEKIGWDKFVDLSADLTTLTLKVSGLSVDDESETPDFSDSHSSQLGLEHEFKIRKQSLKTTSSNASKRLDDESKRETGWKYYVSCPTVPKSYTVPEDTRTLCQLYEELRSFVDQFSFLWKSFREIDAKFWVIEPEVVSPIHLHRRVMMRNSTSVHIEFSQSDFSSIPSISFLGTPVEVSSLKSQLNSNITNWNFGDSVLKNICNVLEIDETMFVEKPRSGCKRKPSGDEVNGVHEPMLDIRCQICLCVSDSNDDPEEKYGVVSPDTVCSNPKCVKRYHSSCIKNWFLSLPKLRKSFDTLFGPCPICKSDIGVKI